MNKKTFWNGSNYYKSAYLWGVCKNVLMKANFKVSNKNYDDGKSNDNHNHVSDV